MTKLAKVWLVAAGVLIGAYAQKTKMAPEVEDLRFQLSQCRSHNTFLQLSIENDQGLWKEFWRRQCGCFTVAEVMDAMGGRNEDE